MLAYVPVFLAHSYLDDLNIEKHQRICLPLHITPRRLTEQQSLAFRRKTYLIALSSAQKIFSGLYLLTIS